jgi:hypothetical protein
VIGLAGALRRSELVGLNVADLQFGDDGVRITIRPSKTDQSGVGQVVGIALRYQPVPCGSTSGLAVSYARDCRTGVPSRHASLQIAIDYGCC